MFSFNNFFCGNLFLRIAGKIAKIVKIRTRKNFVPHGISSLSDLFFVVDSLSLYLRKTIRKKSFRLKEKSFSTSEIFLNRVHYH